MLGLGNSISADQYPGGWTPAELGAKLNAWYRRGVGIAFGDATADDGSTVSNKISEWADQSGNNNHAAPVNASDAEECPTLVEGKIRFSGAHNSLVFTSTINLEKFAIYFRANWATTISNDVPMEGDSNNFIKLASSTELRIKCGGDTREDATIEQVTDDGSSTFNIGVERIADGTLAAYVGEAAGEWSTSGSKDGQSPISNVLRLTQLGDGTQDSTWSEVVICNDALTSDERTLLLAYLDEV